MAGVKTFRDLIAWRLGMDLARSDYRATAKMPEDERFGLTIQLRRAAVSAPSNIAEGFGRERRPEMLRFLRISRGSLSEVSTQYELACSMGMIEPSRELLDLIAETDRVLQGLIRSLGRPAPAQPSG